MDTSQPIRELIIHHHQRNISARAISTMVNVPRSTVNDIIARFKRSGTSTSSRTGHCGRKRKLSKRTERTLARQSIANPRATAKQLQQAVGESADVDISTIRRSLRRSGRKCFTPRKAPGLTCNQQRVRKRWAADHRMMTVENWSRVIFSDECSFDVINQPRTQYVRRGLHERITQQHTRQHRPFQQRLMLWGCFSSTGLGPLVPCWQTMNAERYITTLRDNLLPVVANLVPGNDHWRLVQDNAPCHKANVVTRFMEQEGIDVLPWPPYSPDMNPVENMWAILKRRVYSTTSVSKVDLLQKIQHVWATDPELQACCTTLVESMPKRVQQLYEAKGGYTKY